ncbi:MAG TPA: hypothetical protein VG755_05890, partial [Nannocystaceae bacterium]|nr:hypothetical protein [Nannocystaceae bacterium]
GSAPIVVARPNPAAAAAKAMLFVALGGLLAGAAVLAMRPDLLDRDDARATTMPSEEEPAPDAGKAVAPEPGDAKPEPPIKADAKADAKAEPKPDVPPPPPDEPRLDAPTSADLVATAQAAIAAKHWREPAEGSLALSLSNLAIVEPGNASIGKYRQAAADALLPTAQQALEKNRFGTAAEAFRDLVAVWPDHAEARAGLIEAVFGEARAYKRKRDHAHVLALADELLNLDPGDFQALLLRADALLSLRRYAEAKQAYRECMKIKPRHKEVNKNFWKAATMARKQG